MIRRAGFLGRALNLTREGSDACCGSVPHDPRRESARPLRILSECSRLVRIVQLPLKVQGMSCGFCVPGDPDP